MVERLVLPEGCPGAAENLVGHAAGSPFEPSHDGGHRGTRFEDCMDVIWHDHPRVEFVEPADCLTIEESVHNYAGDSRILQPGGTGSYAVESLVLPKEGIAATLLRGQNLCLRRKGAGKSPRHENSGLLWNPVRQMSAGEGHRGLSRHDRPQKAMVCPTCSRGVVSYRARVSPGNIQTPCRTLPASHRVPTSSKGAYTRCVPLGNSAVMYDGGYLETDSLDARVLSMEYTPQKFSTDDLVAAWKDGSLKINEEYQRGAEWTEPQAQGLIDSIFRKYPIPPIFLHQIHSKGLGGLESTRYEIVDGQQRIRALADFRSDKFPLLEASDKKLRLPNSLRNLPAPWGKRRFSDLDDQLRSDRKKSMSSSLVN